MHYLHLKWLIVIALCVCFSGIWAQDAVTQYTSADVVWRTNATIDYAASAAVGSNLYLGVDADAEGNIYVAAYNNILVFDGDSGAKIDTIVDATGTIQQYSDITVLDDGTVWLADGRSDLYHLDADGTILGTIAFQTSPGFTATSPQRVEFAPDGNIWVNYSSYGIHFQVFTPEGEYIRSVINSAFSLQGVNHFAFAPDGRLFFQGAGIGWISEEGDAITVHEFAPEFMSPEYLAFYGIAIDDEGNVYFSAGSDGDLGVSIFQLDSEGNLIGQYGQGQARMNWSNAFGADELGHTLSLALAPDGDLIIADTNNTYSKLTRLNTGTED